MISIGVLLRRYIFILRLKYLTLVHVLGGGLSSQFFPNEEIVGVLVNRIASSASDGVNHELENRSVVRYINTVTFLSWSSARAKIHMKNRSTIVESFTVRALPTGIIMEKGSIL